MRETPENSKYGESMKNRLPMAAIQGGQSLASSNQLNRLVYPLVPCLTKIRLLQHPGRYFGSKKVLSLSRSEEHTSELQSLMRISYAVFCLKKKQNISSDKINNLA